MKYSKLQEIHFMSFHEQSPMIASNFYFIGVLFSGAAVAMAVLLVTWNI
jgi:hypothetical protein